jgi:hypothetical protein
MTEANADGRAEIFKNLNIYAATRHSMAGLSHGSVTALHDIVNANLQQEIDSRLGRYQPGTKGQMAAGDEAEAMSITYDPTNLGRGGRNAAISDYQKGQLRFIDQRILRGLGLATKRIADDMPIRLVDQSIELQISREALAKATEDLGPRAQMVMRSVIRNIDDAIKYPDLNIMEYNPLVSGPYAETLTDLNKQIKDVVRSLSKNDVKRVETFVNLFDGIRNNMADLEVLNEALMEIQALSNTFSHRSPEFRNATQEILDRVPTKFGITFDNYFTNKMINVNTVPGLMGRIEAHKLVLRNLRDELSQDFTWYDDFVENHKGYQMLQTNTVDQELADMYAARLAEKKAQTPNFLNFWQRTVDRLNLLQNRLFVPLALFSGAWAYHIAINEGTLSTLRNGFGKTYDAKLVASIAKHATNETHIGGFVTRLTDKWDMAINNKLLKIDEGNAVANVASRSLNGALNLIKLAKGTHEVASGLLMGFDRMMLAGMDKAELDRMIGNFVDQVVMEDGQIDKMSVDHTSSTFDANAIDRHAKQLVYGVENGVRTVSHVFRNRTFSSANAGDLGYVTALHEVLRGLHNDALSGPVSKFYYDQIYNAGAEGLSKDELALMTPKEVLARGAKKFESPEDWDRLTSQVKQFAYEHINSFSPEYRAAFARDRELLGDAHTERDPVTGARLNDPHRDWAKALAFQSMHSTSGLDQATGNRIIHAGLVEQFGKTSVEPDSELLKLFTTDEGPAEIPQGLEPKNIPHYGFAKKDLGSTGIDKPGFLAKVTDLGHQKVFGPIANYLVRDPLYLLEYHMEMESLRKLGVYSEQEMQTMAAVRASQKMIRFVHNPLDKMVIEENMRAVAPFYFAQNQAMRRAWRLFDEDPGAFERYLKVSLGVTNWVSINTKNGQEPVFMIPGSQIVGWLAGHTPLNYLHNNYINGLEHSLGMAIGGTPGTVSPMFITGATFSASGIAGNLTRPSWGPIAIVSGAAAKWGLQELHWSVTHHAARVINTIIGPSSAYGIGSEADPSAIGRAATAALMTKINPEHNSTAISTILSAMNNLADMKYKDFYNQTVEEIKKRYGLNDAEFRQRILSSPANIRYLSGIAAGKFDTYMKTHSGEFINNATNAATTLLVGKMVFAIGSPVSPIITQSFSKSKEFSALLAQTKIVDGKKVPRYSYSEALNEYVTLYPNNYMDLVSRYADPFGQWPSTKATADLIQNHKGIVQQYPIAAPYLQESNGAYDPNARNPILGLHLARYDSPQEYADALLVKSGQEYYNYVIKPEYANDTRGIKQAAISWGILNNPTWLQYHTGVMYTSHAIDALNQMTAMVNDKSVFFNGATGREGYRELIGIANQGLAEYQSKKTNSARGEFVYRWYNQMTTLAANNPQYSSFILNVMQPFLERTNM